MILKDYEEFRGRHWETGALHNFMAYRGYKAPHTGKPYSEALLMGVSGGAVMGYFSFAYEGYDPMCRILVRNTFNPVETMLSRLGVVQEVRQTASAAKGLANLEDALESGVPAIVWADAYSLPYNGYDPGSEIWMMSPIVVYGLDREAGVAYIADKAEGPLMVPIEDLQAARGRVKSDKYRLVTLSPPNPDKLASAAQAGIWDCIKIYTEAPPRGTRNNFGLQAYLNWANLLTRPKARLSWEREFPRGRKMLSGLTGAYHSVTFFDAFPQANRPLYAAFLEEAAVILDRPGLKKPAEAFRRAGKAWDDLCQALLPDSIEPFREARELMHRRAELTRKQGPGSVEEIRSVDHRQNAIKEAVEKDFPLSEAATVQFREALAERVLAVRTVEEQAVSALREAMG